MSFANMTTLSGPAAAFSLSVAFLATTIGTHILEWRLRAHPDLAARISSFDLAARTQIFASLSLIIVAALKLPGSGFAIPMLWVGLALFCLGLYLHGVTGATWGMFAVLPGSLALCAAWGVVALFWIKEAL